MVVTRVNVEGLIELRKALKTLDVKLPKKLQQANKEAAEPIAADARSRYAQLHPARSGRGQRSIRALATQTSAKVAMGGAKAPYMLGQEFGSEQGKGKRQFPQREEVRWGVPRWRGGSGTRAASKGKFFSPAVAEGISELGESYDKIIDKLMGEAFPKGRP